MISLHQVYRPHTTSAPLAICEQSIPWLPLHSLAFCLYFLSQNDGYKSQSGRNKIWCKAQISFSEDRVNWPGGLVKRQQKKKYSAGEGKSIITGPPQLRACAKALITSSRPPGPQPSFSLCRTKSCPPELVSDLCCAPWFQGGKSASVNTWAET